MADKRKKRPVKLPIHGDAAHNFAFLILIGDLVVHWSNNESVFLAMLRLLIPDGQNSAMIVWHSTRTTRARLELVQRLCRERLPGARDKTLLNDITAATSKFRGFSDTRNFYCHALYGYDTEGHLVTASGATMPQEGAPLQFKNRRLDRSAVNEIGDTTTRLAQFNRDLWDIVGRLEAELGMRLQGQQRPPLEPK